MFNPANLNVIILAGNDDPGLAPLTHALTGAPIPKQFAFIAGAGSLLQQIVTPYAAVVPPERIVVVVAAEHEDMARTQLHEWHGIEILVRPRNRGPAVDLLYALGRVVARDAKTNVIVAPAHHYVPYAGVLVSTLLAARSALRLAPVILAGESSGTSFARHSMVVPGTRIEGRIWSVGRLVEHPSARLAERWQARGALWNTSTFVARAAALWQAAQARMPAEAEIFARLSGEGRPLQSAVDAAFHYLSESRPIEALWGGVKRLAVAPVRGSGWTEWTSPEQVMDSLGDQADLERLLSRILRRQQALGRTQLRPVSHHARPAHQAKAA